MKLIDELKNKYVVAIIVIILIVIGGFLYGRKAVIEFKMITGQAVDVGDFIYVHKGLCGYKFWDEGKMRSVYGYARRVFVKEKYPDIDSHGMFSLGGENIPDLTIIVGGNKSGEIFNKLLSINSEYEKFSSKKINVFGLVVGHDMVGGCSRGAGLIINDPSQITY